MSVPIDTSRLDVDAIVQVLTDWRIAGGSDVHGGLHAWFTKGCWGGEYTLGIPYSPSSIKLWVDQPVGTLTLAADGLPPGGARAARIRGANEHLAAVVAGELTSAHTTSAVFSNPFKRGDHVLVPAGVTIFSARPGAGERVAARNVRLTVVNAYGGFRQAGWARDQVRPPQVRWMGSGGYPRWANVDVVVEDANRVPPAGPHYPLAGVKAA